MSEREEFERWAKEQPIIIALRRHYVDEHQYASLLAEYCYRAYAAGVEAERARAAKVCEELPCDCCWSEDATLMAEECAAAIRRGE